jgi:hypothetical protein
MNYITIHPVALNGTPLLNNKNWKYGGLLGQFKDTARKHP